MSELQPGRELDAMVAERVMGWRWMKWAAVTDDPLSALVPPAEIYNRRHWRPSDVSAERYYDWDTIGWTDKADKFHSGFPRYSTDIAAAWDVAEKMQSELREVGSRGGICDVRLTVHRYGPDGAYRVVFSKHPMRRLYAAAWSKSLPHAICLAALKAVGEGVE